MWREADEQGAPKSRKAVRTGLERARNEGRIPTWNFGRRAGQTLLKIEGSKASQGLLGDRGLRKSALPAFQAATEVAARDAPQAFAATWDDKYPQVAKNWEAHWPNLIPLFDYRADVRKAIYTTNAIESLNCVIRKATRKWKIFPHDELALKVVYLAI